VRVKYYYNTIYIKRKQISLV